MIYFHRVVIKVNFLKIENTGTVFKVPGRKRNLWAELLVLPHKCTGNQRVRVETWNQNPHRKRSSEL